MEIIRVLIEKPEGPFSRFTVQFRVSPTETSFVGLTHGSAILFRLGLKTIAVNRSRRFVRRRWKM